MPIFPLEALSCAPAWSESATHVNPLRRLSVTLAALTVLAAPSPAPAAQPGVTLFGAQSATTTLPVINDLGAGWAKVFLDGTAVDGSNDLMLRQYADIFADYKAAGKKVIVILTGTPGQSASNVPPSDADAWANWAGSMARRFGPYVYGWMVWNEADGPRFWAGAPQPERYAELLKKAYPKIKEGDPDAVVSFSPLTGGNAKFLSAAYDAGAGDSFDAVGVDMGTACNTTSPYSFMRDSVNGPIFFTSFLAYRNVIELLESKGHGNRPLWLEMGWSTSKAVCDHGAFAGKKDGGVSESTQAQFLRQAAHCLKEDPQVQVAMWFEMEDRAGTDTPDHRFGLRDSDGRRKPSYAAFQDFARGRDNESGPCGDFTPPSITVASPTPKQQFVDKLDLRASATDAGVGLGRITFRYDDAPNEVRNYTEALRNGETVGLSPWQNSSKLGLGSHTIAVTAVDKNLNARTTTIPVEKVKTLAATLLGRFNLPSKVSCKGRSCSIAGTLSRGKAGTPSIGGRVAVEWQFKNRKGKYRKLIGGLKPANRPFTFRAKLGHRGSWRVRVTYSSVAPWKSATSKYLYFKVR